ncbi:Peroxisomal membrane protein 14 [Ostreococcus tauri]|uniref:Peroxisomal membrane protein PEX14 n=1 Tax=Ostreococcus tauri TaxID=70448 RepID=Q01FR3_OSTTA|nr:Peroxisomal membrane protein 14 [Ostreococcus tauri]OUS42459.1 peroxin Pex14 [Ostreococcus tauri]CAL50431.1 Peroxisomal membrane protein 14 [Ostreococcus tauri]|eukprot:XP_003074580.1 Peroxisomal membrane protein 14 [Ostreococcus tauri]
MGEDAIASAVTFLRHPNVRASADARAKRGFLEGKGLREDEIDEAFRRAGEDASASGEGGGVKMPAEGVKGSMASSALRLVALVGAGYLAYPSARRLLERARDYLEKKGDAESGKEGTTATVMSTPMVTPRTEFTSDGLTPELTRRLELVVESAERAEERAVELREEMKRDVRESVRDLKSDLETQIRLEMAELKRAYTESPVRTSSAKNETWPLKASPPESESDGESDAFTPESRMKPPRYDVSQIATTPSEQPNYFSALQTQRPPNRASDESLVDPPHPGNFMDILQMLENGKTPPGIKDVDDTPPNPNAAIPTSSANRPGKPWEATPSFGSNGRSFMEEDVPIKRVQGNSTSDSTWKPPPAPEFSRVMSTASSSETNERAAMSPKSPRRSVDDKSDRAKDASHYAKTLI